MDNLSTRRYIIFALIALVFLVFIGRLFSIQVLSTEYARKADNYVIKTKPVLPPRGNIYDRENRIFVSNEPMFNMLITPAELQIPDTSAIVEILGISSAEIRAWLDKAPYRKESVFARYIDPETYGRLQERLWNAQGISFAASTKRSYRYEVGANILGYISEVSQAEIDASEGALIPGDLIGKAGIERSHDTTLRGIQGVKKVLKNVHNREVGSYADGRFDQDPVKGKDIILGIDTELQAFGEELMQGKKGSIVAIEPHSGEVLAFVSAPTYNPSELTGRDLRTNWRRLRNDTLNPLYNRPLMARYPPGSIFKIPVALAALNEGIITPETYYKCGGGFWRNRGKPGCRMHATPLKLETAIKVSCNAYFAATYMDFLHSDHFEEGFYQGYQTWYDYMSQLGVGHKLSVDLPYEVSGLLPTTDRYDRWYGHDRWVATTVISNAIGQGEILMTPLQMANMVAIVANRGFYVPPHFLVAERSSADEDWTSLHYEQVQTTIARPHFETVIEAMESVVAEGTARRAYLSKWAVCGKTGTVQNPHGKDHAVFIGFAPKERPRIAVAVVIENAGGGGSWAAPTAALMMEHYLNEGKIEDKTYELQRVRQARFIPGL
ncbi:MAG: penicillin-binding protein 2 [Bacteroidetes bacterium]|nr:MAG: penicillin-binding protein 2 [Bacteroidota bacterium]